jgi:alpha-glucosidase (family GH31 glycosyl hydrolase)
MKTSRSLVYLIALAPAALIGSWGCSKSETTKAQDVVQDVKTTAKDVAADVKTAAVDTWDSIKDFTFEKRSDFSAGVGRMADSLDAKIADVRATVSTLPDAAAKDKNAAIKEYDEARADLKVKLADLGNATADGWSDAKAKVAASWAKVQAAYTKATS